MLTTNDSRITDGYWLGISMNDISEVILKHLGAIRYNLLPPDTTDRSWPAVELRKLHAHVESETEFFERIYHWSGNLMNLRQEFISEDDLDGLKELIEDLVRIHDENANSYYGIPERFIQELKLDDVSPRFQLVKKELDSLRATAYRYQQKDN